MEDIKGKISCFLNFFNLQKKSNGPGIIIIIGFYLENNLE